MCILMPGVFHLDCYGIVISCEVVKCEPSSFFQVILVAILQSYTCINLKGKLFGNKAMGMLAAVMLSL